MLIRSLRGIRLSWTSGFFQDFQVHGVCNGMTGCRPYWDPTGGFWLGGVTNLLGFIPQWGSGKSPGGNGRPTRPPPTHFWNATQHAHKRPSPRMMPFGSTCRLMWDKCFNGKQSTVSAIASYKLRDSKPAR
jgi:hypothetical protein